MGKAELPLHAPGTKVDRGYIGQSVPRANAARLLQGRGTFLADLRFWHYICTTMACNRTRSTAVFP